MFIRGLCISCKRKTGSVPVYLNVYDLTPMNGYAYWFGLGIYHSGVQVHGVEYAYGAHDHPTTGIFEGEPRQCPGFRFRKSILIGRTDLGPREVRTFMEKMAESFTGSSYHLITKNCNHFCNDVCLRLVGRPIPRWVNRLANIGTISLVFLQVSESPGSGSDSRSTPRVALQLRAAGGASRRRGEAPSYPRRSRRKRTSGFPPGGEEEAQNQISQIHGVVFFVLLFVIPHRRPLECRRNGRAAAEEEQAAAAAGFLPGRLEGLMLFRPQ